ncbi:Spy/CpxP family protein refolding chaperone [Glaciimonas immobilis]|uniref:Spy/CpxP family protein refolding chaperone n=1 Tax=Glaciimonas immobilis TaxID=728004 RepID=A0A840S0C6_9BURK|nr:Spy/CpxP family protein refolding chaperone [Glaciimonas immobilis]KAF3998412.1 Spy/CpxP family protein refolding chaperone [Glaciimonas immobilis]MBB5202100.1 Spy/CpxP family protein refolding chaperone [Glaciimonas immobilis]
MFKLRKQLLIGITAMGIGAMGMGAYAQNAPAGAPAVAQAPAPSEHHMHQPPTPEQRAKFEARMAKRQAKLHQELKITPAQEGAWKTYIDQMKPHGPDLSKARPTKEEWAKQTAPERMDHRIELMKKMEEHMSERAAALKQFYAVLTPEQQKVMDTQFSHMHHGERGHRDHGGESHSM